MNYLMKYKEPEGTFQNLLRGIYPHQLGYFPAINLDDRFLSLAKNADPMLEKFKEKG
jgi:hypothetical protein